MVLIDEDGATPAHIAAENGHANCLDALHQLGCGPMFAAVDGQGRTAAHLAAESGHADCLRAIHALGYGASFRALDEKVEMPSHAAAFRGHPSCLRALLELGYGETLHVANEGGFTAVQAAICRYEMTGDDGCLFALFERGVDTKLSCFSSNCMRCRRVVNGVEIDNCTNMSHQRRYAQLDRDPDFFFWRGNSGLQDSEEFDEDENDLAEMMPNLVRVKWPADAGEGHNQ